MFSINNEIWDIKFVDDKSDILFRSDGSKTIAVTDDSDKTIYISKNIDLDMLRKVICHEVVHCLCFSLDIYFDIYQEEKLADFIATYGKDIIDISEKLYNKIIRG